VQALVATEDERFLNTQALTGGTLRAIASLGTSGGASTLTQQPNNYSMVKVQSFAF
jgi:penicillin-binding protein 1A